MNTNNQSFQDTAKTYSELRVRTEKKKSVSRFLIIMALILFVASAVLLYMSFVPNSEFTLATRDKQVFTALDKSIVSVVLDEIDIQTADSLMMQTYITKSSNPSDLFLKYKEHLNSYSSIVDECIYRYDDYDNDGRNEYYIQIQIPVVSFFEEIGEQEAAESYKNISADGVERVVIYGDTYDNKIVFRAFLTNTKNKDLPEIIVQNGMLEIIYRNDMVFSFIVGDPSLVFEDYSYQAEAFRQLCASYCNYLLNRNYKNTYYYCADVCDAPGEETVFVYSENEKLHSVILTFKNGKAHYIYENQTEDCATYLIKKDSKYYILEYFQDLGNKQNDYTSQYRYKIFRFDDSYMIHQADSSSTTVSYGKVSADNEKFFAVFNEYLKNATVLTDPYELTGYKILSYSTGMSTHETDFNGENATAYLRIANCSTSKQGIVNVGEYSYLNFRKGASTNHAKILINNNDSESFVRQLKGSSVTVIDTENTGDNENPIWVKIQIKYNDLTLVGYSSQKYIDLPGIRHIAVGDSFTVTADTNEKNLFWSCNDTSVAEINSSTGEITALSHGLVLITVTSPSGLTDSCLIAVD